MAEPVEVYLESGKRRAFAAAVRWPGWSRAAKSDDAALQTFVDYRDRYAAAVHAVHKRVPRVDDAAALHVVERVAGDGSTEFGVLSKPTASDTEDLGSAEAKRQVALLQACWDTFDRVAAAAGGHELRTGPRGGGRQVDGIVEHVLGGETAYLAKLGGRVQLDEADPAGERMAAVRAAALDVVALRVRGEPAPRQPRAGSSLWPVAFFIRRSAWHALDHAWEIEDRLLD